MVDSKPSILSSRISGILLHPTSLPGRFGIGDLGHEAYRFVDFLASTRQQLWQVLPLGPTGAGDSPYMSYSSMAGNPLLISLERLRDEGFLSEEDFSELPDLSGDRVDYGTVNPLKMRFLRQANDNFNHRATPELKDKFEHFCHEKAYWLEDFALFMALKHEHQGNSWFNWEPELAKRNPEVMEHYRQRLTDQIRFEKFLQFEFFRQWSDVKHYANSKGIHILGDIPIYVAHDSVDVWAHREIFCLDSETNYPTLMAGTPPDFFSQTGQLWGNPVYNWDYLQQTDFQWWVQRFHAILDYVDLIRIDHFLGFAAYWVIRQGETSAINGQWLTAPGETFFNTLRQKLGMLPIIAEDLGILTPEAEALRDQFGFPGMKILHFAFGGNASNPYLPFNYPRNCVVYTGTHDNETTVGWFNDLSDHEKASVLRYIGCISSDGIHWDLIRLAFSSTANLAIAPLQDVLGLDNAARMNAPGKMEGNWQWRYRGDALTEEVGDRLRTLTEYFGRTLF